MLRLACWRGVLPPTPAGARVKRLQAPPGAQEQTLVIWSAACELPAPGRAVHNAAQVWRRLWGAATAIPPHLLPAHTCARPPGCPMPQAALLDCVQRVLFQESAPVGQPSTVRLLIGRSQEPGVQQK